MHPSDANPGIPFLPLRERGEWNGPLPFPPGWVEQAIGSTGVLYDADTRL